MKQEYISYWQKHPSTFSKNVNFIEFYRSFKTDHTSSSYLDLTRGTKTLWYLAHDVHFSRLTKLETKSITHTFKIVQDGIKVNFFHHIFPVVQQRILFINHKTRMLSLTWVLNSSDSIFLLELVRQPYWRKQVGRYGR